MPYLYVFILPLVAVFGTQAFTKDFGEVSADASGDCVQKDADTNTLLQTRLAIDVEVKNVSCPEDFPVNCGERVCIGTNTPCPAKWYTQQRLEPLASSRKSRSVVTLTYCDANYAYMWPTFMKCYQQALGCSSGLSPETCGENKPKMLDLGISPEPGHEGHHCSHKGLPAWTTGVKLSKGSTATSSLQVKLTPAHVPYILMTNLAEQLASGRDVLRLDSDAFLLENVMQDFQRFPDADIISSVDFVGRSNGEQWYHDARYLIRHNLSAPDGRNVFGNDPLRNWGFMMNTGVTFFRSSRKTSQLARRAALSIKNGRSKFEQIALNEELVNLNCTWTEPERLPHGGNSTENWNSITTTPMLGKCAEGLNVVVLPTYAMTRDLDAAKLLPHQVISMHPADKELMTIQDIASLCESRQASRLK